MPDTSSKRHRAIAENSYAGVELRNNRDEVFVDQPGTKVSQDCNALALENRLLDINPIVEIPESFLASRQRSASLDEKAGANG